MKKRIIFILTLLMIPIVTNATINNNYETAVSTANTYAKTVYNYVIDNYFKGGYSLSSGIQKQAIISYDASLDFVVDSNCYGRRSSSIIDDNDTNVILQSAKVSPILRSGIRINPAANSVLPYDFYNNKAQRKSTFYCGGMLTYDEFNITKNSNNETYLFDGNDYWTMTEEANKAYVITHDNEVLIDTKDKTDLTGVRATQYFESIYMYGEGSYSNPWSAGIMGGSSLLS